MELLNNRFIPYFRFIVTIRDILTWVNFLNICVKNIGIVDAYIHGACLTFLDSLGSGITSTERYEFWFILHY